MRIFPITATLLLATALALGTTAGVAGAAPSEWQSHVGAEPVDTVAELRAARDAFSPARSGPVQLGYVSRVDQHVRIVALDRRGRTVRTIVDADVPPGPAMHGWDGTDDAGRPVPDGDYELVVEAGTERDSMSISDLVRVDRRAPTVVSGARRVRLSRGAATLPLAIVASEPAFVEVTVAGVAGRSRIAASRGSGRSSITVPVRTRAALRRALTKGRARVTARIVATDPAGNRTARTVHVELLPPLPTVDGGGGGTPGGDGGSVVGSSRLTWPLTGPITSRFGPRWGRMHQGIDVGVPTGRPIAAAAPGTVSYAGWMGGYGNVVIVDHGSLSTLYAHQSGIAVRSGQGVARGHVVGYVGSTGNSTGPHLHFEVRVGGVARDPLRYLP